MLEALLVIAEIIFIIIKGFKLARSPSCYCSFFHYYYYYFYSDVFFYQRYRSHFLADFDEKKYTDAAQGVHRAPKNPEAVSQRTKGR